MDTSVLLQSLAGYYIVIYYFNLFQTSLTCSQSWFIPFLSLDNVGYLISDVDILFTETYSVSTVLTSLSLSCTV